MEFNGPALLFRDDLEPGRERQTTKFVTILHD